MLVLCPLCDLAEREDGIYIKLDRWQTLVMDMCKVEIEYGLCENCRNEETQEKKFMMFT